MYRFFCSESIKNLKQCIPVFHLCLPGSSSPRKQLKLTAKFLCSHEEQDLDLCILTLFFCPQNHNLTDQVTQAVSHGTLQGMHTWYVLLRCMQHTLHVCNMYDVSAFQRTACSQDYQQNQAIIHAEMNTAGFSERFQKLS